MNAELHEKVSAAVRHFWTTREAQGARQGSKSGNRDAGDRAAVTGGKQLAGFVTLVHSLLCDAGLHEDNIHVDRRRAVLPGFFRPTKEWDIVALLDKQLLATIEFKSQVGPSFGNNFNNRAEEAIGSAHDVWVAYREGAFGTSPRPWLGYLMLLEEAPGSMRPVGVEEPHFPVFPEFKVSSYAQRYALLCKRLVRERLYDSACLLMSTRVEGTQGLYTVPDPEISCENFAASLTAHAIAHKKFLR